MKFKEFICLLGAAAIGCYAFAQDNDVLMTVNGKDIAKAEFEYIYNKNNSSSSLDKKTLNEYVELYKNFRLKVAEAEAQGLDTTKAYQSELKGYRSQLAAPYLTDEDAEEKLIVEAYNRMAEDVDVSHILIRVSESATPADTLAAYKKALEVRKRLNKEDFEKVAREVSQDQSVERNGGHIGYINAFATVYPFETAAYQTPVGKITNPVRSQFGYHIIKVNDRRPDPGEVLIAHIMVATGKEMPADTLKAKEAKINSIYARVKAGEDFKTLALQSDDKNTAINGGQLPWIGIGRVVPEIEKVAFSLQIGEVSQPVQSPFGWHIVKLIDKKTLAPFAEKKDDIEHRIHSDERSSLVQKAFIDRLKKDYNFKENTASVNELYTFVDKDMITDSVFVARFDAKNTAFGTGKVMYTFADKTIYQSDYVRFITDLTSQLNTDLMKRGLDEFEKSTLIGYEDSQLDKKYPEFAYLMQEYHDGTLLFEISNKEVWEKSQTDTLGLKRYFEANKDKYAWAKPHFKGIVVYCDSKQTAKEAKSIIKKAPKDSIDIYLNKQLGKKVKIEKGLFEQGTNTAVDKQVFKTGNFAPVAEYPEVFVADGGKILAKGPEDYADVKGTVVSDYQNYLEEEWVRYLQAKYPVVVNENVLKTVKNN